MALTEYEKQRILDKLDELDSDEREAVTESEDSLWRWLKRAANWLWERLTESAIGKFISWLIGW